MENDDAVGHGVGCRHFHERHLAILGIEMADVIGLFVGEPESAIVIEGGRVWIDFGSVKWAIFCNLPRLRIELAHVSSGDRREPDVAVAVGDQTVRAGVGGL